jgi:hypothetical protein
MAIDLHYVDRQLTRSRPLTTIGIKQIPSLLRMTAITGGSLGLPALGLAAQLSYEQRAEPEPHSASEHCACGLALAEHASAYNEEAFHFLLGVERKRFEQSSRPFVLMLLEPEGRSGQTAPIAPADGARVFACLASSVRDTDVIGWYSEGHIPGAVLTHFGDASIADVSRLMAERVTRTLRDGLPEEMAGRLKVRLYQPLTGIQP